MTIAQKKALQAAIKAIRTELCSGNVAILDVAKEEEIEWTLAQGYVAIGSGESTLTDVALDQAIKRECHERIGELHDALNAILGIARNV